MCAEAGAGRDSARHFVWYPTPLVDFATSYRRARGKDELTGIELDWYIWRTMNDACTMKCLPPRGKSRVRFSRSLALDSAAELVRQKKKHRIKPHKIFFPRSLY